MLVVCAYDYVICIVFFFCGSLIIGYYRADPKLVGMPGKLIIIKPIFFASSPPSTELAKLFKGACPNREYFSKNFFLFSRV